jgi:hypothetical protein
MTYEIRAATTAIFILTVVGLIWKGDDGGVFVGASAESWGEGVIDGSGLKLLIVRACPLNPDPDE